MSPKFTAGADALTWLPNTMPESDTVQHVEDDQLFSLFRNGRYQRLCWNELTSCEKEQQVEASRREQFNAMFNPNGGEW